MWLMTGFGILMPAIRPPKTIARGDLRTMQIRSRRRQDLDILRAQYMPTLGATIATPQMDYNFRAYCTPDAFAVAMMKAILDIDYLKFKPTTEDRYGDAELHTLYNRIWSVVTDLNRPGYRSFDQPIGKYGTTYPGWSAPKTTTGTKAGTGISLARTAATATGTGWAGRDDEADDGSGWVEFADGQWRRQPVGTGEPDDEILGDDEIDALVAGFDDVQSTDLATLYAELDDLRAEQDADRPVSHADCVHGTGDRARERCRRKHRRDLALRIEALHRRIDRYYDTLDQVVNTGTVLGPAAAAADAAAN